jgi:hypothetical protein
MMMSGRSIGSRVSAVIAGAMLTAIAASPAVAQSIAALEDPLATAATTAPGARAAVQGQTQAPEENPVLKFFAGTELTGFVDTYYSYNFNTPKTPCNVLAGVSIFNCLHAFDVAHNAFSMNVAELMLEKKPTMDSRAGYRIDLDYGPGAALVAGFEPGASTSIYQNIQQAYVSYLASTGTGSLQFDFGKFVTPAGFEVIESKDNWNYSRGLLFTLAIPRYHQGLRVAYSPNNKTTITGLVFNGWNNSVDNNGGKSVGVQFVEKPTTAFAVAATYIGGPELPNDSSDWRHLIDVIATYTISPTVRVAANYDFGKELSNRWQGGAAYLRYQPTIWFALTPRCEFFDDGNGWALIGQGVGAVTLTGEFKHKDGVMMRVEYRRDFTTEPFFVKNASELVQTQQALTVAWVYTFSSKTP